MRCVVGNVTGLDGLSLGRRGPVYRPGGFLRRPVASAQVAVFGFLASLALLTKRVTLIRIGIAVFIFLMLLVHLSVKEIIAGCLALMLFVLLFVRSDAFTKAISALLGIVALGLVFTSVAGDQVAKIGRAHVGTTVTNAQ